MLKTTHGKVHGRTVEIDEDLGVPDGQGVELQVKVIPLPNWGEGLRRCAGALANEWTSEDDRILEEIHRERKQETRREISEWSSAGCADNCFSGAFLSVGRT